MTRRLFLSIVRLFMLATRLASSTFIYGKGMKSSQNERQIDKLLNRYKKATESKYV